MYPDHRLPQQLYQERLQEAEEERRWRAVRRAQRAANPEPHHDWAPAWVRAFGRRALATALRQG